MCGVCGGGVRDNGFLLFVNLHYASANFHSPFSLVVIRNRIVRMELSICHHRVSV